MSHFEYVITLSSFVVAFGVARLLAGWARQYALRAQARGYLLQTAVSALLLVALLQNTWAFWFARDVAWTFVTFMLMVFVQLALVGSATLVHPPDSYSSSIRDYYFEARHAVFGLCAVWIVLGGIVDFVLISSFPSELPLNVMLVFPAVSLFFFILMAWSDRVVHHWIGFTALLTLQIGWVIGVGNNPMAF